MALSGGHSAIPMASVDKLKMKNLSFMKIGGEAGAVSNRTSKNWQGSGLLLIALIKAEDDRKKQNFINKMVEMPFGVEGYPLQTHMTDFGTY